MKKELLEIRNKFMRIKDELQTISRSLELNNKELKKTLTIIKSSSIRCFGWILLLWILIAVSIVFAQILRL